MKNNCDKVIVINQIFNKFNKGYQIDNRLT